MRVPAGRDSELPPADDALRGTATGRCGARSRGAAEPVPAPPDRDGVADPDEEPADEAVPADELPELEPPSPPRGEALPVDEPVVFGREPAWPNAGAWLRTKTAITAPMMDE
ncbi:MAG: hypothetical protein H0T05_05360 [Acidobacteria bacterium]|nr:hypothetical protein [Acidobacteriota bacterium]MBA3886088.1 hypothetical protein [Acidobacteriota bacterium]